MASRAKGYPRRAPSQKPLPVIDLAEHAKREVKRTMQSVGYGTQGCVEAFEAQDWKGLIGQALALQSAAGRLLVAAELQYTVDLLKEGQYVLPAKETVEK